MPGYLVEGEGSRSVLVVWFHRNYNWLSPAAQYGSVFENCIQSLSWSKWYLWQVSGNCQAWIMLCKSHIDTLQTTTPIMPCNWALNNHDFIKRVIGTFFELAVNSQKMNEHDSLRNESLYNSALHIAAVKFSIFCYSFRK